MAEKKRILFLYCGGTIGQIPREVEVNGKPQTVLYPPDGGEEFQAACDNVLSQINELADLDITFETFFSKDSSNVVLGDWRAIAERIKVAQDDEGYQAVAIAHGTDTLAHTATALGLSLHGSNAEKSGLSIPVVFTGAQNTIYVEGGDGTFNLQNVFRVVQTCIEKGVADVLVSFWSRVLLGSRTVKVSEKEFDAFRSPGYPDVGTINSLGVSLWPDLVKKRSEASFQMELAPKFSDKVVTFELGPGLLPEVVLATVQESGAKALILKSLGEGNVPTEGDYNFVPLIETLTNEYDIPVIISSRFVGGHVGSAHYEVGLKAIQAGGIAGLDHTGTSAEVKARWLVGNELCHSVEGFRKAYVTSYAGEVTIGE